MSKIESGKIVRVPPEAKIIGLNLCTLREEAGLTRKEVGEILKVSIQQVQKYESGQNRFPLDKLYMLRPFFGVSYERFFQGLENESARMEEVLQNDAEAWAIYKKITRIADRGLKRKIRSVVNVMAE